MKGVEGNYKQYKRNIRENQGSTLCTVCTASTDCNSGGFFCLIKNEKKVKDILKELNISDLKINDFFRLKIGE